MREQLYTVINNDIIISSLNCKNIPNDFFTTKAPAIQLTMICFYSFENERSTHNDGKVYF